MLKLLLGRAGTGKTRALLEAMAAGDGRPQILIVPEQHSHSMERQLCAIGGSRVSLFAEVLSFTRLANRVFSVYGGLAAPALDGGGRLLLLCAALKSVAPELRVYQRPSRKPAFLSGLLAHMGVEAAIHVSPKGDNGILVTLEGPKLGALIGHRGETLDAIQQLTNYSVNRSQSKRVRIHVDAEGYRAKREESLQRLAVKVAGKVVKYRKNMTLEPMNAYERHVIHAALQDYPNVTTYSTGVEPNRRTVVAYAPGQK